MTLGEINSKITQLTGASTSQYTVADRAINLNIWYQNVVSEILDSQDESDYDDPRWGNFPRKVAPITTNRDYSIPVSEKVLKIKDFNVSYDGVNWYRATPLDTAATEYADAPASATTAQTDIDANYSRTSPRYDIKFGSVFLYPKATQADVDAGGKIMFEWFREPKEVTAAEITTGTEIPGFDASFHPILPYGASYEYLIGKDVKKADKLMRDIQVMLAKLRKQYSNKQLDRQFVFQPLVQNYK